MWRNKHKIFRPYFPSRLCPLPPLTPQALMNHVEARLISPQGPFYHFSLSSTLAVMWLPEPAPAFVLEYHPWVIGPVLSLHTKIQMCIGFILPYLYRIKMFNFMTVRYDTYSPTNSLICSLVLPCVTHMNGFARDHSSLVYLPTPLFCLPTPSWSSP